MNAPMNMNSALENLKQQEKNIDALVIEEMTLRKRIAAAITVRREFSEARSNLENAKSVRRELLGSKHLSGKADHAKKELSIADTALTAAQNRAESLAGNAEGAQFALERLEPDAQMLHDQVAALRKKLAALQLAAAIEEAGSIIADYIAVADEFENSFASVVGALQQLEHMRHSDKPPFFFHPLYPCALELPPVPYLERFNFHYNRSHLQVTEKANQQRQCFINRLQSQGILEA